MSELNNDDNQIPTTQNDELQNTGNHDTAQETRTNESLQPESDEAVNNVKVAQQNSSLLSKPKIDVLLKPAGDAPIMKKKKWAVDRNKQICWVSEFIKKYLKFNPADSLFLYVNQSFSPSPDTNIGVLFDCFGSDGKLVLHYCKTQAWG